MQNFHKVLGLFNTFHYFQFYFYKYKFNSFGKSYRPKLVDKGREKIPGPGYYTKEEKKTNSEHVSKP